jgi:hypothetical protein
MVLKCVNCPREDCRCLIGAPPTQTIINLAEITGKESVVTLGYRDVVKALDDKDVRYTEFDFHNECKHGRSRWRDGRALTESPVLGKGMKYENIGKLIDQLSGSFSEQG